jgi:flagellin
VESVQSSLSTFDELNKSAIDAGTKGIGRLVDADMNETAARLKALEVLQQLAVQALGIANSEPPSILELFL